MNIFGIERHGAGLLVLALTVAAGCKSSPQQVEPAERGGRGESCQARNDCQAGLACVANTCSQNDFPLSVEAKSCDIVECQTVEDCCGPLPPPECANQETICYESQADPLCIDSYLTCVATTDCATGQECSGSYCMCPPNPLYNPSDPICLGTVDCTSCQLACEQERCVLDNTCTTASDCFGGGTCENGRCIECAADTDCLNDERCNQGVCQNICTQHEECPLFSQCQNGDCVEVGCTNDRECVFAYAAEGLPGARLATCVTNPNAGAPGQPQKQCRIPCDNDAECGAKEVCQSGICTYIGCASNEECRAELGLENETKSPSQPYVRTAVCR